MSLERLSLLNLKSVQKSDPLVSNIKFTAQHVVLYSFSEGKWEKADIEGSLMLYSRRESPVWAIGILNRLQANNYHLYLNSIESFENQKDLFIYATTDGSIFGLWFYAEEDKATFCNELEDIFQYGMEQNPNSCVHEAGNDDTASSSGLLSMLLNAASISDHSISRARGQPLDKPTSKHVSRSKPNIMNMLEKAMEKYVEEPKPRSKAEGSGETDCNGCERLVRLICQANHGTMNFKSFYANLLLVLQQDAEFAAHLYTNYYKNSSLRL